MIKKTTRRIGNKVEQVEVFSTLDGGPVVGLTRLEDEEEKRLEKEALRDRLEEEEYMRRKKMRKK